MRDLTGKVYNTGAVLVFRIYANFHTISFQFLHKNIFLQLCSHFVRAYYVKVRELRVKFVFSIRARVGRSHS